MQNSFLLDQEMATPLNKDAYSKMDLCSFKYHPNRHHYNQTNLHPLHGDDGESSDLLANEDV